MQFLLNHATAGGSSRINIKTAVDHVYAGTNGNLYLEVCDTNDSKTCCKQTFDGPFKAGGENIFAFNTAFQKCLESSIIFSFEIFAKKLKIFYFVGLTGNDGWKSNELKIYFDGSTEELCTLDGGKWLDGNSDNPEGKPQPRLPLKCQKGIAVTTKI